MSMGDLILCHYVDTFCIFALPYDEAIFIIQGLLGKHTHGLRKGCNLVTFIQFTSLYSMMPLYLGRSSLYKICFFPVNT